MIAESFTIAVKNMRKKKKAKKEEKPKVEFDLKMLENLSVSDSDKEEGELSNLSDASSNSWKAGRAKALAKISSRISNKKSRKLKNYLETLFSTNLADNIKLKSKPYASKQAKLTGRLQINKGEKNNNNINLMPILIGELKTHPKIKLE